LCNSTDCALEYSVEAQKANQAKGCDEVQCFNNYIADCYPRKGSAKAKKGNGQLLTWKNGLGKWTSLNLKMDDS